MAASVGSQHRCVFVGNIPYDATEEQLVQICEEVGPVVSFRLVSDRETGKPKGYGFCEYKDEETALSARRNLQGYEINGRQLRVDFAENDKNADRNREQGRGGPGTITVCLLTCDLIFTDVQKQPSGAPNLVDPLHQPIGFPFAATAANAMAAALDPDYSEQATSATTPAIKPTVNKSSLSDGNLELRAAGGVGEKRILSSDSIKIILGEVKRGGDGNRDVCDGGFARSEDRDVDNLFDGSCRMFCVSTNSAAANQYESFTIVLQLFPGRTCAAFFGNDSFPNRMWFQDVFSLHFISFNGVKAQVILGMVTPQMMKIAGSGQTSSLAPSGQLSKGHENQLPVTSHTSGHLQQAMLPLQQIRVQPQYQLPPLPQNQVSVANAADKFGVTAVPSRWPQSIGSLPVQPQQILQRQPTLPQLPVPTAIANIAHNSPLALPNVTLQQSNLIPPLTSQPGSSSGLPQVSTSTSVQGSTWPSAFNKRGLDVGFADQSRMSGNLSEQNSYPIKFQRLDDGTGAFQRVSNSAVNTASIKKHGTSTVAMGQVTADVVHSEKSMPQLLPDVESALLQQVLSLTPEQLSSLPLEQQQQIIQLQKMLSAHK
ncbi:hypothetical protein ZIOFF_001044 [Zingiber officinale]|uniref:RRM domain-containing protein n=1 Tax=Zingiber officinale TaxID=94328 RepID=A0A8J5HUC7_ZINOF|nr:hypothetical protein ZIOFF_001044 [Zingiber officinale]